MTSLYFKTYICIYIYARAWRFVQPVRPGTHASKQFSRTGNVVRNRKYAGSLRVLAKIERGGQYSPSKNVAELKGDV